MLNLSDFESACKFKLRSYQLLECGDWVALAAGRSLVAFGFYWKGIPVMWGYIKYRYKKADSQLIRRLTGSSVTTKQIISAADSLYEQSAPLGQ